MTMSNLNAIQGKPIEDLSFSTKEHIRQQTRDLLKYKPAMAADIIIDEINKELGRQRKLGALDNYQRELY